MQRTIRHWVDAVEHYPATYLNLHQDRLSDFLATWARPATVFIAESRWWGGPSKAQAAHRQLLRLASESGGQRHILHQPSRDGTDSKRLLTRRSRSLDRPKAGGRWGLLSRSVNGWYNAEYLPQIAAYADAILRLGYPHQRVLFELPASALQLDLAILDDVANVAVLGEAKRETGMLLKLVTASVARFGDGVPGEDSKKRGDEARQLAWRLSRRKRRRGARLTRSRRTWRGRSRRLVRLTSW